MTGQGRPLRFLALVLLGWTIARVALLWPSATPLSQSLGTLATGALPLPIAAQAAPEAAQRPAVAGPIVVRIAAPPAPPSRYAGLRGGGRVDVALLALLHYGAPQVNRARPPAVGTGARGAAPVIPAQVPDRLAPLPDRWSASGWLVVRGAGTAAPAGGQLGGGQAGFRLAWLAVPRARVAAVGRVTTPLRGKGREASIGVEWQPSRAPVRLVVEHRFGLDGTPGGPGAGVIAGVDAKLGGFRLEGYGQAGAIRRVRTEPYADGAARVTTEVAAQGPARIALGIGAWGGAQRDAQRLDVGPSATVRVRNLRLSLDWRQRVAGAARPGSGATLTLGGDF